MAIVVISEWAATGRPRDTSNYDAITERLGAADNPPEGMILQSAGYTDDDRFQIIELWETNEHANRFRRERLMPLVAELAGANTEPPDVSTYETHSIIRPVDFSGSTRMTVSAASSRMCVRHRMAGNVTSS